MAKIRESFRLKKEDVEYLQYCVNSGKFQNKTEAIINFIDFYRSEQGLEIEMQNKLSKRFVEVYSKLIPFLFGCLFAYFFLKGSIIFVPFLLVALFPFVFKLDTKKDNILRVRI